MIHQKPDQQLCDDEKLIAVLSDGDQVAGHQEVVEHIEQCSRCQQRLDELAAGAQDWTKARQALLNDDPSSENRVGSAKWDYSLRNEGPVAWTESMASQLLSPASHPELLGRIGRYDVERLIGSGGMGVVFKAHDSELNRPVAIKILAPYLSSSGPARKRFAREARAAAAVVHEHVVPIYNVETERETPFLVMHYIAGESLQGRIDREGALELCEILRIGMQVASGLSAAHQQGLVHRDIKPSNILMEQGVERALITDFGLARAADDASLTRTGFHPGTPQYMSPEQAAGEQVDARSDLFSLGSVLYTMCTGRPPFRAETSLGVLRRITDVEPRPIREINPNIPEWLCSLIARLMSKSPEDRFANAREVAEQLEQCLAHVQQPTSAPLPTSLVATVHRPDFKATRTGVMTMLGFIGTALLGMVLWQTTEAPDISGQWTSDEWGTVVLEAKQPGLYEGTLSNAIFALGELPAPHPHGNGAKCASCHEGSAGKVELKWSRLEHRFNGTWTQSEYLKGKLSVRLTDNEIRGAWTTSGRSQANPGMPRLADLLWMRSQEAIGKWEPPTKVEEKEILAAEKAYQQLLSMDDAVGKVYREALSNAKDDIERKRVDDELDPRQALTPKYLAFEEKFRGTPAALEALTKVMRFAKSIADPTCAAAKGRIEAVDRLITHYLQHDGIEKTFGAFHGGPEVPRQDEFLQAVLENSSSRHVQAAALVAQLEWIRNTLNVLPSLPAFAERVAEYPEPMREALQSQIRRLESTDSDKLRAKANDKIKRLKAYQQETVAVYGTASNAAQHLSHAINRVIVGRTAPEITATTTTGKSFHLSKLRGTTVVLVFADDEGVDNDLMYAPLRKLATEYEVEVVMILSSGEGQQQSAAALKRHLPWTVIPQAYNGPIVLDWGIEGTPSVYLIDLDGILHPQQFMPVYDVNSGYDTSEVAAELDKILALKQSNNNDGSSGRTGADVAKPLYADLQGDWIIDSHYTDEDSNSREWQKQGSTALILRAIRVEANELYFRNPPVAGMTRTCGAISLKPVEGNDPRLFQVVDSQERIRFGMYKVVGDKLTILLTEEAPPKLLAPTEGEFYIECHRAVSEDDKELLNVINKNPDQINVIDLILKDFEKSVPAQEAPKRLRN